jgi:hypothetical protein
MIEENSERTRHEPTWMINEFSAWDLEGEGRAVNWKPHVHRIKNTYYYQGLKLQSVHGRVHPSEIHFLRNAIEIEVVTPHCPFSQEQLETWYMQFPPASHALKTKSELKGMPASTGSVDRALDPSDANNVGTVAVPAGKRRGRPKGSKNKQTHRLFA